MKISSSFLFSSHYGVFVWLSLCVYTWKVQQFTANIEWRMEHNQTKGILCACYCNFSKIVKPFESTCVGEYCFMYAAFLFKFAEQSTLFDELRTIVMIINDFAGL